MIYIFVSNTETYIPYNLQFLWIPDVIIHDLVKFSKPEILNEVAALEIFKNGKVYYKIRQTNTKCLINKSYLGMFRVDSFDVAAYQ